jgi:hypothetical protein
MWLQNVCVWHDNTSFVRYEALIYLIFKAIAKGRIFVRRRGFFFFFLFFFIDDVEDC